MFGLRFSKAVRKSLAGELKKLSWLGSGAFTLAGLALKSGWLIFALIFWWFCFQVLAHILIGLEENEDTS